ncbi:MAG: DNA recombination protein RmuC [Erysipelotrichaceae bacterium]
MEPITIIFSGLIVVLIILLVLVFRNSVHQQKKDIKELLLENERRNKDDLTLVKDNVNRDLILFQNTLLQSLQSNLNILNENTGEKLMNIEKNVKANLTYGFDSTHKVFSQVMEQMGKMDQSTKNLQELSGGILSLQKILNDKKTRGIYGEVELYSLLDSTIGSHPNAYKRQYTLSSGVIADAVLFLGENEKICIDSKFPLENYNRLIEAEDDKKNGTASKDFVHDVKKHIQAIHNKYIIPHETSDFAFMFIPAEAIFAYLHSNTNEIVSYSYEQKVYLVSPTTLMAYITAIKAIYIEQKRSENMDEIRNELKKLSQEFERFEKRYTAVQNDFERTYNDMRNLGITANKMLIRFSSIQEGDINLNKGEE